MAKHSQSARFVATGLFKNLNNFRELEARISALPSEKERGDAFEVFAEAYLASQPICQAKSVWPQTTAPSTLLTSLGLPVSRDMGTDGLLELKDGRIASYQAKFYTGRPSLTWSLLSTFFAISDRVSHTIIFTNSDTLASTIEQRQNFLSVRGVDLDRLTVADLLIIEEWLRGEPIVRAVPKPYPHQEKALADILAVLAQSNRATAIMACGTGKTLLSLWTAEGLNVKNVLVLVPSLALIQQTLHGWLSATSWSNLAYLCVCSDPTITDSADDLIVKKSDLDFEVTTSPTEVKRFIDADFDGVKVVFSTYMSAAVVGQAVEKREFFDLGIFDEAHKTAGIEGKKSAFAISDENLPLKKRIFMTATPRHYNVLKRDKTGEAKLVYSMDVPESYGPVAHKLPFAEAARAGIICGYKVAISVVTTEMVEKELLSRGKVLVAGDEIHAQQVANQIALAAAISKYGVGKVITFHKNIKSAQSFTASGPEGISSHLADFSVFHVNGTMPSAEREKLMSEFRTSRHGLVSNAKCLTEGIDVPAVDMVAFLSPKRSTVDIVQATGRAMRKAPDKEFGYILVPLYLEIEKGESIEDAVRRGDFEEIWDVLSALQEQDDILADIIRAMRQDKGRKKGFNDSRLREQVEVLGPSIQLEDLRRAISVVCVENLSSGWEESFAKLVDFKDKSGHCDVPQKYKDDPELGLWVANYRRWGKSGMLSQDRTSRLTEIGFSWDPWQDMWMESYNELLKFFKENGHSNLPLKKLGERSKLQIWVLLQRVNRKKGQLTPERIALLDKIGFEWNRHDAVWEKNFSALVEFKQKHSHCDIPYKCAEFPQLGPWVIKQRRLKKTGEIPEDKIRRLEDIGFAWESSRSK